MRKIKRLFLIVSTFLFAIALASCDNTKRNTTTPMGSIDSSAIATAGEYNLTADVFYSQLRNQGYNPVLNNIKLNQNYPERGRLQICYRKSARVQSIYSHKVKETTKW